MAKKRAAKKQQTELSVLNSIKNTMEETSLSVMNAVQSRSHYIKKLLDPRRDINDDCGYPADGELTVEEFCSLYRREGVAKRVNDILAEECWKSTPSVYETSDADNETEFEKAFNALLSNEDNHYSPEEQCHPLWEILERADKESGKGRFGILLYGFNDADNSDLSKPVEKATELAYVSVFSELDVSITDFETDPSSPRCGMPIFYNVNLSKGSSDSNKSATVHWTRVEHIVDNVESNRVYGTPRMEPSYNRLADLRKLYGGSSEMYWRGAFPGLVLKPNPQLDLETVTVDKAALRDSVEQYMNTLQRYFYAEGLEAQMLAPTVVDPSPQVRVQIEAICIQLGCPLRIFMGSERGELASSQDADSWESRLKKRRVKYIAPSIIAKVVNRLIKVGVLPVPPEGFKVSWEETKQLSEEQRAKIAESVVKAIAAYIQSDADNLIAPEDFLTKILTFTQEEAKEILEAAEKYLGEQVDEDDSFSEEGEGEGNAEIQSQQSQ